MLAVDAAAQRYDGTERGRVASDPHDHHTDGGPDASAQHDREALRPLGEEARRWLWDLTVDLADLFVVHGLKARGRPAGRRVPRASALHLSWLLPESSPFDSFRRMLVALLDRPHLRLVDQRAWVDPVDADEVDDDDPDGIAEWKRGRSASIPARQKALTNDTPEHQAILAFLWGLRVVLRDLDGELARLEREVEGVASHYQREAPGHVAALRRDVRRRQGQLRGLLGLPLLEGVQAGTWPAEPTGVLLHDPLYRRVFVLMRSFERMPDIPDEGRRLLLGVMTCERWRLFELWCLFRVRDALRQLVGEKEEKGWFEDAAGPLRLVWGGQPAVVLEWPGGTTLRYRQPCPIGEKNAAEGFWSPTLVLEPDFIVEHGGQVVVVDAKCMDVNELGHRGADCPRADPFCRPFRPWHQAHVYRDGIRIPPGLRPDASLLLVPERGMLPDDTVRPLFAPGSASRGGVGAVSLGPSGVEAVSELLEHLRAWREVR